MDRMRITIRKSFGLLMPVIILFIFVSGCDINDESMTNSESQLSEIEQTIVHLSTKWTEVPVAETLAPSLIPTVQQSQTVTLTPTIVVSTCSQIIGTLEYREFVSGLLNNTFGVRVYLPPCYDAMPSKRYPVLILLHNQGHNDDQWDRLGADEVADILISEGETPPFIIVMPRENDTFEDDKVSVYGSVLIDELIPWIDEEYQTCTLRECRAIGGISRGGAWALRMGLMNWDLFGSIGAHSLAPFSGDFYESPYWFNKIPEGEWPRIFLDMGTLDFLITAAGLFEDRLTQYGIPHEWIINSGTHNEDYWSEHVEDYIRWYTFPWKGLFLDLESDIKINVETQIYRIVN